MELRAEQYQQIVSHLRSEYIDRRRRSSERRGAPRVGLRAQVQLIPCRTGVNAQVEPAWIRDISQEGVGLIYHELLEPGTFIVLTLPAAGSQILDILFEIVRCTPLSNGQFSLGARFHRVITAEDMK